MLATYNDNDKNINNMDVKIKVLIISLEYMTLTEIWNKSIKNIFNDPSTTNTSHRVTKVSLTFKQVLR